jgi:hypothetical protein
VTTYFSPYSIHYILLQLISTDLAPADSGTSVLSPLPPCAAGAQGLPQNKSSNHFNYESRELLEHHESDRNPAHPVNPVILSKMAVPAVYLDIGYSSLDIGYSVLSKKSGTSTPWKTPIQESRQDFQDLQD